MIGGGGRPQHSVPRYATAKQGAAKPLIARGLSMGDEMHMRNAACSSLILRELAGDLAETATRDLARILRFVAGNDMFFLNVAMAMAKATVRARARHRAIDRRHHNGSNGYRFRHSRERDRDLWFRVRHNRPRVCCSPGSRRPMPIRNRDSCITETVGLGGFAMAASPAVVGFIGAGTLADAIGYTRSMREITLGTNADWALPTLDMTGVPTAIDIRKVLATGLLPVINTAIANRLPGRGRDRRRYRPSAARHASSRHSSLSPR